MNHRKQLSGRSGLLLMELIIAIAFFCGICAICLQIFAKAHTLQENSKQLNFAVTQCSSASEVLSATGELSSLEQYFEGGICDQNSFVTHYNKEQLSCSADDFYYEMTVTKVSEKQGLVTYSIKLHTENATVYELECVALSPEREVR